MNLIENRMEGRVEWRGNGVVLIKERSFMLDVWRFCKQCEWQVSLKVRAQVRAVKVLLENRRVARQSMIVERIKRRTEQKTRQKIQSALNAKTRLENSLRIPATSL